MMSGGDFVSSATLVSNPVDAYNLVKRLTIDWDVVERVLEAESNSSRSMNVQFLSILVCTLCALSLSTRVRSFIIV